MPSTRRIATRLLLFVMAAGAATYLLLRVSRGPAPGRGAEAGNRSEAAQNASFVNEKALKAALALEAQRNELDQTAWASELTAQKHEDVFVRLWDQMRAGGDAIEVLKNFEFGVITLGTLGQTETLENDVTTARSGPPTRPLRPADWRQMLTKLQAQGWRIENSEWRHVEFRHASNEAATSVFAVTLHGRNQPQPEQFVARGRFKVTWRQGANAAKEPSHEPVSRTVAFRPLQPSTAESARKQPEGCGPSSFQFMGRGHGFSVMGASQEPGRAALPHSRSSVDAAARQRRPTGDGFMVAPQGLEALEPFPERIEVSELELLRRRGEPGFEWALAREIKPDLNPTFIDPLILYDLNGDGLSEIILACRNQIFWNLGSGRFRAAKLCDGLTNAINTAVLADFTGDAAPDLLAADAEGLLLFAGNSQGKPLERSDAQEPTHSLPGRGDAFRASPGSALPGRGAGVGWFGSGRRIQFTNVPLLNPFVMTAGDIDADGDLDLWLAQYKLPYVAGQMPTPYYDANDGFPSFLLLNDGHGGFVDRTEQAGLAAKRFRRTYSASFVDLDDDADLDLFVVSDFAGVDVYLNDGRGRFTDATRSVIREPQLFGMAHTFGDYDLDGLLDCFAIGMNSFVAQRLAGLKLVPPGFPDPEGMRQKMAYGNRLYFQRARRFEQTPLSDQVAQSGWSWGVTSFDFDNDADPDLYIANGHKSRVSAKDYESQFWRHDIYVASSEHDPARDVYFQSTGSKLYGAGYSYGGYHKNRLFMNRAGQSFVEIGHLMGVAMELDCRNVVSDDLDGDGKMDLLVTTLEEWPQARQSLHLFKNRCPTPGNWIGVRLREGGAGFSHIGTRVTLHTANRRQVRQIVMGDSYRSQHAPTVHFGLGPETSVVGIEVRWGNGKTNWLSKPALNQYHSVPRP